MGVLDGVFGGSGGLIKTLASTFGGSAAIIYVTPGIDDEETDTVRETTTVTPVSWLPSPGKISNGTSYPPSMGGFSMAGGMMYEKADVLGTVPSSDLAVVPTPERDRIRINGTTYTIKSVIKSPIGELDAASYIIAGVQA